MQFMSLSIDALMSHSGFRKLVLLLFLLIILSFRVLFFRQACYIRFDLFADRILEVLPGVHVSIFQLV